MIPARAQAWTVLGCMRKSFAVSDTPNRGSNVAFPATLTIAMGLLDLRIVLGIVLGLGPRNELPDQDGLLVLAEQSPRETKILPSRKGRLDARKELLRVNSFGNRLLKAGSHFEISEGLYDVGPAI